MANAPPVPKQTGAKNHGLITCLLAKLHNFFTATPRFRSGADFAMTYIHPNDRVYVLERALASAAAQGEDRKVLDDLREILAEARREARG